MALEDKKYVRDLLGKIHKSEIQRIIDTLQTIITGVVDILKVEYVKDPVLQQKITKVEDDANKIIDLAQDIMDVCWKDLEPKQQPEALNGEIVQ